MADDGSSKGRGLLIGIAVAAMVLAVVAALVLRPGMAKVEGATAKERIASIIALADSQPRGAVEAIADAAANDPDASVRRAGLLTLERFMSPEHRPIVESALEDTDEGVRAAAAATLGRFGDRAAADRLGEVGVKDTSHAVRLAAAQGLAKSPDPKAVVHLVNVMEKGKDEDVQVYAKQALSKRYKIPLTRSVRPAHTIWWRNDVELLKEQPEVISAFRRTHTPLKLNPRHVVPDTDGDIMPPVKLPPPLEED